MHLDIHIRQPIARRSEADFVVQILIDVVQMGEFPAAASSHSSMGQFPESGSEAVSVDEDDPLPSEYVVGRIWAERLDWSYAEECGYSIPVICDAASATWIQVLETLSRNGGRSFRKELHLEDFVNELIFVHEILLHPEIIDRIAVMDSVLRGVSDDNALVLMHHEQSEPHHLEDWEYRDLGFKKIARSNLLLKDNHYRYPFGESFPVGRDIDFTATVEHETWLLEHWENLIVDHPSS